MADSSAMSWSAVLSRPRYLVGFDLFAMCGFGLIATVNLLSTTPPRHAPYALLIALAFAMCIPVATRRFWPLWSFVVCVSATVTSVWLGGHNDWFAAAGFTLYLVASRRARASLGPTTIVAASAIVMLPCLLTTGTSNPTSARIGAILVGLTVLGVSWIVGQAVRDRRIAVAEAARRLADREVSDERLRIARELHDVVGNTLSLIAVKAQIASHVAHQRPQAPTEALADIESVAKDSLTQMRLTLGVLRSPPTHTESDLSGLIAAAENLGVKMTLVPVPIDDLTAEVQLAVVRIIHEAVTNVIKHAAPTSCEITMQRNAQQLTVRITDTGRVAEPPAGAPVPSTGNGITGMAERVAAFGGQLDAGASGSGFEVRAVIPLSRGMA